MLSVTFLLSRSFKKPKASDEESAGSKKREVGGEKKSSGDSFSLMPELDDKIYEKCREEMRLFQETIIALGSSGEKVSQVYSVKCIH